MLKLDKFFDEVLKKEIQEFTKENFPTNRKTDAGLLLVRFFCYLRDKYTKVKNDGK